jgi:nicotinamide mononucleotide adenylyltransferase
VLSSHPTDTHRTLPEHNPFNFWERLCMVEACLGELGFERSTYRVLPMPIEDPGHISNYFPRDAVQFITIYDNWGRQKALALKELSYDVEVMWEATDADRITSGRELRARMRAGTDWRELVTPAVARTITRLHLLEKVRNAPFTADPIPLVHDTAERAQLRR